MKHSIYILLSALLFGGIFVNTRAAFPTRAEMSNSVVNAAGQVTRTPIPTPTLPPLIKGLGTPVQTPQSYTFNDCPPGGAEDGETFNNAIYIPTYIPQKDYAKYLSPESLANYVKSLKSPEQEPYLKLLNDDEKVKYVAGFPKEEQRGILKELFNINNKNAQDSFLAKVATYQGELYQNKLKNRTDNGNYKSVPFQTLLNLPPAKENIMNKPAGSQWENRGGWAQWQMDLVYRYEGLPIQVKGFIFYDPADSNTIGAQEMNPESTNCFGKKIDHDLIDWHITFVEVGELQGKRKDAVVVEATPRIRNLHPGWTLDKLREVARKQYPVRMSGWLFFDPEHTEPAALGNTRGTLWEIHPVMKIEVQVKDSKGNCVWVPLDMWSSTSGAKCG